MSFVFVFVNSFSTSIGDVVSTSKGDVVTTSKGDVVSPLKGDVVTTSKGDVISTSKCYWLTPCMVVFTAQISLVLI
jgi:hypothetical protein